jgi:hypothetical protein
MNREKLRLWWRYTVVWYWIRKKENAVMWIAFRLPKSIAYWSFVRMASDCPGNPGEQTCIEVLKQHQGWAGR